MERSFSHVTSHMTHQTFDMPQADVFGNTVSATGSSTGNLGFQSKYFDTESGMYYYYNRYYKPDLGRFLNEDPIGLSGGLNMYGFVGNDPVNWIDPNGLDWGSDHPEWMKLFCKLWTHRRVNKGRTRKELGSWLYNSGGDSSSMWWSSPFNAKASPRHFPHNSVLRGSVHTHPNIKSNKASRGKNNDTGIANKYHPRHKMYIISDDGIYFYDPMSNSDGKLMDYDKFRCWCKKNKLWKSWGKYSDY